MGDKGKGSMTSNKVWIVIEHEFGGSTMDDFTVWGVWSDKDDAESFKRENENLYEYRGTFRIEEHEVNEKVQ